MCRSAQAEVRDSSVIPLLPPVCESEDPAQVPRLAQAAPLPSEHLTTTVLVLFRFALTNIHNIRFHAGIFSNEI